MCVAVVLGSMAAPPAAPVFRAVEIDTQVEIGYGLAVADVDGDGQVDILLADKRLVVWYRNPGWDKHVMAENLTERDHVCIAAADVNGDGKAEVAVGAEWNPGDTLRSGAVFYLVPPADRTQRWEPVQLHHEPTVHRMRWVKTESAAGSQLVVVPLHGRGNKNGQGDGVRILAYQIPMDSRQPWMTNVVDDSLHLTHNFDPVQWDGDPGQEMLVASREGVFLFDRRDARWEKRRLAGAPPSDSTFPGAGEVRAGTLPGGLRFFATIEPMHGNTVAVYTPPAPGAADQLWSRHQLADDLVDGHALVCGDFNRSGSDQLVVGWRAMGKREARVGVRLYSPMDNTGRQWKPMLIDDNGMACEDLAAADLNGDGKLDLVAAGRGTRNVKIYFNETP